MSITAFLPQSLGTQTGETLEVVGRHPLETNAVSQVRSDSPSPFETLLSQQVGSMPARFQNPENERSAETSSRPTIADAFSAVVTGLTANHQSEVSLLFSRSLALALINPVSPNPTEIDETSIESIEPNSIIGNSANGEASNLGDVSSFSVSVPGSNSTLNSAAHDSNSITIVKQPISVAPAAKPKTEISSVSTFEPILEAKTIQLAYSNAETPISEEIAAEITRQVGEYTGNEPIFVQIRLDESELGQINLNLSVANDVVSIRIVVQNQDAVNVLNSQLDVLKQSLANNGVMFDLCQISSESNGKQLPNRRQTGRPATPPETTSSHRVARLNFSAPPAVPSHELFNFVA